MRISRGVIAAVALAACGPPRAAGPSEPVPRAIDAAPVVIAPPPPDAVPPPLPLDRDMPALAARLVELYQTVGDTLTAAGTDCARAATGVIAVREQYQDVRDATARVLAEGRIAQLEPELDRRHQPIAAAMARILRIVEPCRTDVRLNDALEGLAAGG